MADDAKPRDLPEAIVRLNEEWLLSQNAYSDGRNDGMLLEQWQEVRDIPGAGLVVLFDHTEEERAEMELEPGQCQSKVLWADGKVGPVVPLLDANAETTAGNPNFKEARAILPKKLDVEAMNKTRANPPTNEGETWPEKYQRILNRLLVKRAGAVAKAARGVIRTQNDAFFSNAPQLNILYASTEKYPDSTRSVLANFSADPADWVMMM